MRAKTINEAIGFERYKDPKVALGVIHPRKMESLEAERKAKDMQARMNESLLNIEQNVKTLKTRDDDGSFSYISMDLEILKSVIEFIIINHLKEKFNFLDVLYTPNNFYFTEAIINDEYSLIFESSISGKSISFRLRQIVDAETGRHNDIENSNNSSSLKSLDSKIIKILKNHNLHEFIPKIQ